MDIKELKKYRTKLTKQQLLTLRGQIKSGHPEAAKKGLQKLLSLRAGQKESADA